MSRAAPWAPAGEPAGKISIYAKALAMQSNGKGHKERKYIAEM